MKQRAFRQNTTGYVPSKKARPLNRGTSAKHYLKENIKIH